MIRLPQFGAVNMRDIYKKLMDANTPKPLTVHDNQTGTTFQIDGFNIVSENPPQVQFHLSSLPSNGADSSDEFDGGFMGGASGDTYELTRSASSNATDTLINTSPMSMDDMFDGGIFSADAEIQQLDFVV